MQAIDLDEKISSFLHRKEAKFPELKLNGRDEMRTVKYAESMQPMQQILFSR